MTPPIKMSSESYEMQNTFIQRMHVNKNNIPKEVPDEIIDENASKIAEKYGLRPRTIIKRLQQETKRQDPPIPKKVKRSKSRTAPLSKYRRKTANSRERDRMKEINIAFDSLRKILPEQMEIATGKTCSTKIMTLRLAVAYIQALSHVLEEGTNIDCIKGTIKEERGVNNLQESSTKKQNADISTYIIHSVIKNENDISNRQCSLQSAIFGSFVDPFGESNLMNFEYDYSDCEEKVHNKTLSRNQPKHENYIPRTRVTTKTEGFSQSCQQYDFSMEGRSGSLSSTSELEELLSDDSHILEDHLNVFQDFSMMSETNPLDIFLSTESGYDKGNLCFVSHQGS